MDLDGTLCFTVGEHYAEAAPDFHAIDLVNRLRADGHYVIIDTARGSMTGTDWGDVTREQLARWGVGYDELRCGVKVAADLYIDDRAINAEEWKA